MNITKHASGDNIKITQFASEKETISLEIVDKCDETDPIVAMEEDKPKSENQETVTTTMIEENETKLKERIIHCKNIIASLKLELNEEKSKLEKEAKEVQQCNDSLHKVTKNITYSSENFSDGQYNLNTLSACVDSKLNGTDENLIEYEKQLERYQNTLNMAQIEKKNAIRKQMLAKAFKLKLMEVENQCNIELLRIKQSLQCLEPLKMIVEKWKNNSNDDYDLNNFELIPRYPELSANSGSDITNLSGTDEFDNKLAISNLNIDV